MARASSKFSSFARDIHLATADLAPESIASELAKLAKEERDGAIKRGEASPIYDTYVNGVRGAAEETVKAPGPILYVFSYWQPIIEFTLDFLRRRGPDKSGRYKASHSVMIGSQFIRPEAEIAADEEVTIVSTVPYSRKIEVGHMRMSVEHGVYIDTINAVSRRFGGANGIITLKYRMIYLPNGYILKGHFQKGYLPGARTGLKRDTRAGARMTYPAIIMRMKGI